MEDGRDLVQLFVSIGLSEIKAKETLKNANVSAHLKNFIDSVSSVVKGVINKDQGLLLCHVATKIKPQTSSHIPLICRYIVEGKIDKEIRLTAAMEYLLSNPIGQLDIKAFEESCGVGVVVTGDQIEAEVEKFIKLHRDEMLEKRYRYPAGALMNEVRNALKWADGGLIKKEVDLTPGLSLGISLVLILVFVTYWRMKDVWDRRQYKRVDRDFLIDGLYSDA